MRLNQAHYISDQAFSFHSQVFKVQFQVIVFKDPRYVLQVAVLKEKLLSSIHSNYFNNIS